MQTDLKNSILVIESERGKADSVAPFAKQLSRACGLEWQVAWNLERKSVSRSGWKRWFGGARKSGDACRNILEEHRPEIVMFDWQDACESGKNAWETAVRRNLPAMAVKSRPEQRIERLLVIVCDETLTFPQLSLAGVLSAAWRIPVRVIRMAAGAGSRIEATRRLLDLQLYLAGLEAEASVVESADAHAMVAAEAGVGDFLILGMSDLHRKPWLANEVLSTLRLETLQSSFLVFKPSKSVAPDFEEVFSGRIAFLPELATAADEVRDRLNRLAVMCQLPEKWKAALQAAAHDRKRGQEIRNTTFVSAQIPGLQSVIGCLGVVPPAPVSSGRHSRTTTESILAFLTPHRLSPEYMSALSKLSEVWVLPKVLEEIGQCRTSAEVLRKLNLDAF